MIRRIFDDPVVQGEIERSRACLERSRNVLGVSRSMIEASNEAIRASRALMHVILIEHIQLPKSFGAADILAEMNDQGINELIDNFADAYVEARKMGNDEAVAMIGKALKIVGRYLATDLGPKAAGVVLN